MIDVASLTVESRRRLEQMILGLPSEAAREAARQFLAEKLTHGRTVSLERMAAPSLRKSSQADPRQSWLLMERLNSLESCRELTAQC